MKERLKRAYYQAATEDFIARDPNAVLGELVTSHGFAVDVQQRNAWQHQIQTLKVVLTGFPNSHVFFEFSIPRMGKRVDVVLLISGVVFVVEYKVGLDNYAGGAQEQAVDYAVDLKNFHEASHFKKLVPVVVATNAAPTAVEDQWYDDGVATVQLANDSTFADVLSHYVSRHGEQSFSAGEWAAATYKPTPTICEAAQALYAGHNVSDISRSDANAINLSQTSDAIARIIDYAKSNQRKSICFITGVPGSGKTLAGLNIANHRLRTNEDEYAVFLSGNGPLVHVLREALARDEIARAKQNSEGRPPNKKTALTKASTFIQNIHHFRDENLRTDKPPIERVVIFDEAQRAWNAHQTSRFMKEKRGLVDFDSSEPEFLLSVMNRHVGWCTVVCLVGGGQEINTGEAGLSEWFDALRARHEDWDIYVSEELNGSEHFGRAGLQEHAQELNLKYETYLHLGVSIRSFRSEKLSSFVHALLEGEALKAKGLIQSLENYPIGVTRDLGFARNWLRSKARGSERYGFLAHSNGQRLKAVGLDIRVKIDPVNWFLNDRTDVRSSYYLEDIATEFDVQGLELDWAGVCWDATLRRANKNWSFNQFKGARWMYVNDQVRQQYLLNAYRVLLTRARQGMVIYVPKGDVLDPTRLPEYYDPIFNYLRSCGLELLE